MTTERWNIDPSHSAVRFTVRHLVISRVHGSFERWQGTLDFDEAKPSESKIMVRIEAASISTGDAKRDDHLRSTDFLDVTTFPLLTFQSEIIDRTGNEAYRMIGELSLHGIAKPVELAVELLGRGKDPWGGDRIGFRARTTINRRDFGLMWNQALETGGLLVGEKVEIDLDVQAIRAVAQRAA